jgi:acyl-CoA thioester hydrolase
MSHSISYRIYYEDTDAGGVVYHANYLKFCERGRTEFLRAEGYTNSEFVKEHGLMFVVRHIDANYLKPAFLEDEITVETSVPHIQNTSLVMRQEISKQGATIFTADVTLVCVDKETVKPVKMPENIKQIFQPKG